MIYCGDCLEYMDSIPDDYFDLVLTSPPYEDARTYGIDFKLKGQAWVDWAKERFIECCRVSKGLVAWVVEGKTKQFSYSATPILLAADLKRAGIKLRKPPVFHRIGIPGSGGPDWLRNDYEFVICASGGKLPWSDNTAMGHAPKYSPGGQMSYRHSDGRRINAQLSKKKKMQPKVAAFHNGEIKGQYHTKTGVNGDKYEQVYIPPTKANPGNVIKCNVGKGHMGHDLAHENEAPYPESLAEFFVRSFCPPGGSVFDPFCGSGTTLAVATKTGRVGFGCDIRESQKELTLRRLQEVSNATD